MYLHVSNMTPSSRSLRLTRKIRLTKFPCTPTLLLSWRSPYLHNSHRAATTGSLSFIRLLLDSSMPPNKTRLNNADRIGTPLQPSGLLYCSIRLRNTPFHLAMDSAHAEAAVVLINAGADRGKVRTDSCTYHSHLTSWPKLNLNGEAPEDVEGVGGSEERRAKQYVIESCGNRGP
jgi:26S proteasome non-ATPase regulatory subunit 10